MRDKQIASPVFVLGCAWRCGSTLLQRLLTSSRNVFIWGEHVGMVSDLVKIASRLELTRHLSHRQSQNFAAHGPKAWIANINPNVDNLESALLSNFLSSYYEVPTRALGFARWGFKEVRYDARLAASLLSAFPESRVIFLVRDLKGVLSSNAANDWYDSVGGPRGVTARWIRNVRTFLEFDDDRVLRVSYSKLANADAKTFNAIVAHARLSLPMDMKLLDVRVRAAENQPKLREQELEFLNRRDTLSMHRRLASLGLVDDE